MWELNCRRSLPIQTRPDCLLGPQIDVSSEYSICRGLQIHRYYSATNGRCKDRVRAIEMGAVVDNSVYLGCGGSCGWDTQNVRDRRSSMFDVK